MADQIQLKSREDIFYWPDGFWCYREERTKQVNRPEHYEVAAVGTARWHQIQEPKARW